MKIGSQEIISSEKFIVTPGNKVTYSITHKETVINIILEFQMETVPNMKGAAASWGNTPEGIKINFSPMGQLPVVISPEVPLGEFADGSKLMFCAEYSKFGNLGVVFIQIMSKEDANGPIKI